MNQAERDECAGLGGCRPVLEHDEIIMDKEIGNQALDKKISKKVSWKVFTVIFGSVFLTIIGVTIYFSDLRVQAREYPETQKIVQQNKTDIAVIKEGQKTMITAQNTTNDLLKQLINKLNEDDKRTNHKKDIEKAKPQE